MAPVRSGFPEARAQAASLLVAVRFGADAAASPDATRFESVAETVFRRYARVWKPRTLYVNRHYLRRLTAGPDAPSAVGR